MAHQLGIGVDVLKTRGDDPVFGFHLINVVTQINGTNPRDCFDDFGSPALGQLVRQVIEVVAF